MRLKNWLDLSRTGSKDIHSEQMAMDVTINGGVGKMKTKSRLKLFSSVLLLLAAIGFSFTIDAQPIYSRKSSTWTDVTGGVGGNGTWSLVSVGGTACGCVPGPTNTVTIGGGNVVSYPSNITPATISSLTLNGGAFTFGSGATVTTLIVTGDVTVTAGTLQSGASGGTLHTLQVGGNFTNSGTVNFTNNAATNQTLQLSPLSAKIINGTAVTTTLGNLVIGGPVSFGDNTATSRTLAVTGNMTVNSLATYQSGSTAAVSQTTQIAGNLTNNGTFDLTANGATNHTASFTGASKTLAGSTATTSVYKMSVSGSLSFGDNANARTLTIANDLTIAGGTLQSGSTAALSHNIQLAGNLVNNGTINMAANAATNHTLTLAPASAKSITGTATTATLYNLVVNGTTNFGDNANARTYSVANDMTIGAAGTFQSGNTGALAHNLQIAGNLVDNGALNLTVNSPTNQTLTFNAGSTKTISGTATSITTYNLAVSGPISFGDNANVRTLNITNDATVNVGGTLQSGSTAAIAHNIVLNGNLINNGTVNFSANSATNHTITFSNSSAKTIRGSATGSSTLYNVIVAGTVSYGDNANTRSWTIANDLTINSSSVFQSGSTAAIAHTLQVGGSIANSGTYDQTANSATNQTVTFIGSAAESIGGTGTFTFNGFTMNTSSSANVSVNTAITINGALTFSANGIIIPLTTIDITLGSGATVSGSSTARYIQLDDTSSSTGQIIKISSASTNSWKIVYPIGSAVGGYTPMDLSVATFGGAITAGGQLAVKSIYGASVTGQMRRQFRLSITGNASATTVASETFSYNSGSDISVGDVVGNYTNRWYLSFASGTWLNSLTGTAPGSNVGSLYTYSVTTAEPLSNGTYYFALGNSTAFTNIWYSYQNGVWNDPEVWTLDPSGTTLNNPLVQVPLSGDQVVILSNITVTSNVNNLILSNVTIQSNAVLDMVTTTGHTFGTVLGSGLLRVGGTGGAVNLPSATYTAFVASTGGTIEYYASSAGSYTVSPTQTTYNNLLFSNASNTAITFVTAPTATINLVNNSFLVNGTLNITQTAGTGSVTWQINDATATSRNFVVTGDFTVSANAKIKAGTGAAAATPHTLKLYGNFTNNGTVQFLDPTDATFASSNASNTHPDSTIVYTAALRGNAVTVTFTGATDQTITCNNKTDFYRLVIDKGTVQKWLATVNSSAKYNMRLFGPANLGSGGATYADGPTTTSHNALSIVNGTLELTGTLRIPLLTIAGSCTNSLGETFWNCYFSIPQSGGLWVNGAGVNVIVADNTASNGDQRLLVGGLLKVSSGTLSTGYSKGINSGAAGVMQVEGGTVTTWQIRPTTTSTNNFSYKQSGGTVNVGTGTVGGVTVTSYARFSIPSTTGSFEMTGGILNVRTPTSNGTTGSIGGIDIQSAVGSYNVTGGTVNCTIQNGSASDFGISSTAPFNNVTMNFETGVGASRVFILNVALKVLDDLTLVSVNGPKFYCNSKDLTIGGDFNLQSGTTFNTGTVATPGGTNIITFNGSANQSWTQDGTIGNLSSVVMNKTGTLTLAGAGTFPSIVGSTYGLALTAGTLADGGKTLTVANPGILSNSATVTGSGLIVYNSPVASIGGAGGTYVNLNINSGAASIQMAGSFTVTGTMRLLSSSIIKMDSYSLTVLNGLYVGSSGTATTFSATQKIQVSGNRNDGGVTLKGTSTLPIVFPVGTTAALYQPITITVTATTMGTITVKPVAGKHPNALNGNTVAFYWSVTSSGFPASVTAVHSTYTYASATKSGTLTSYVGARWDPINFKWSYSTATYNATAATTINIGAFNTATGWNNVVPSGSFIDGEYTSGESTAFSGTVTVYYCALANNASGNWSSNSTWSTTAVGGPVAGSTPCATCPVVIGNSSFSQTVNNDADNQGCGSLYVDQNSTLDCASRLGLSFGINTSGTGKIRISRNVMPSGDFLNFIGSSGGTIEWYGGPYTIPTNSLNTYYKLIVNASTGALIMPASNLTIYSTLTKSGANSVTTDPGRNYTLNSDFNITAGSFIVNTASGTTAFTQTGNLTISPSASFAVSGATGTHTYSTNGNITNNGTFNCSSVMNLTFTGATNNSITGTTGAATTTLSKVTINKGTDQTYALTLDAAGTLTTQTNNWLTITNGTFNFNKTGSTITLTNAATTPYTINNTAKLKASGGTIEISKTAADDSDLFLNGELEVAGGTVYVGNFSTKPANNNDIEYAATGTPELTISGGTLYVNGAIRRPTAILSGALIYNQTGGSVSVGGQNALNARAVFDLENNAGSVFNLKGTSNLTIVKGITTSPSFSDLYLVPETSSVDATSTIFLGSGSAQNMTVNTDPTIGNFYLNGGTTVTLQNSTVRALGTVTISSAGILRSNSLDVSVGGDFTMAGTGYYDGTTGSGNTLTFNGTGAQAGTILGTASTSTFLNMTIDKPSGTVTLTGLGATTSITTKNLNILNGTLAIGTLDVIVTGDIVNNSIESSGTGAIELGGTSTAQNITSSDGQFDNLRLFGTAGSKTVTVTGDMTINKTLTFSTANRYLSIGSDQLNFTATGAISGAASTAFIKTNGVSSDLGVVKTWAVSGTPASFIYGVGTRTNYTPITMTLTVSQSGDMSVIPVDDRHPTANTASSEPISNYYWIITRGSSIVYSATGSHIYAFPSALMGGTAGTGTLTAGYLDVASSNPGWITTEGSATTTSMNFTNSLSTNLPAVSPNDVFHYAVGTINTLPNPIIPIYSRLADPSVASAGGGSWNDVNSWTTASNGMGSVWGSIPSGNSIKILAGATINIDQSGRKAFISEINGTLALTNNKVGHNLGIIKGTGTLKTTQSKLPAGNYTTFVSAAGGTVEYVGPISMDNARTVYNNIATSGTVVTVPALDLTLNGGVTIKSGSTLNNSANRNISVGTGWTNSGGTYTTGTGMLTFNSALAGTITGSTPFYNVTVNKTNNLTLAGTGPTTITNTLTLTSGNIISVTGNKLTLPTAATITGGSSSSFIAGPMVKTMASGTTFNYPVGSVTTSNYRPAILANTTAADTWTVEYVGNDPTNQGYSHTAHTMPIQRVSMFEYWNISRVGSTASDVTLSYSTGSYIGSDIGVVANLRVVHWNTATSQWEVAPGGGTVSQLGTNITGTVTTTNQTSFSPDALGSLDADSPLPVTWLSFVAYRVNNTVELDWSTASERNNDHFEVLKSSDGKVFTSIGKVAGVGNSSQTQHYKFVDKEVSKSGTYYYRIKQVDLDGKTDMSTVVVVTGEGKAFQHWAALPNPSYDNSHFHIELLDGSMSTSDDVEIQIVSASGVIVYQGSDSIERFNKKLDVLMQGFGTGIYIVQISNGQYKENFRIARM